MKMVVPPPLPVEPIQKISRTIDFRSSSIYLRRCDKTTGYVGQSHDMSHMIFFKIQPMVISTVIVVVASVSTPPSPVVIGVEFFAVCGGYGEMCGVPRPRLGRGL
jgi:hypothetical protein